MSVKPPKARESTAEEEYKKDPKIRKEDVELLQRWVKTQPDLPRVVTEKEIILFYHSCYYDIEATKNCIKTYYSMREDTPEFFSNRNIDRPEFQHILNVVHYGILPVKDPNGYQIIYHKLKKYDASSYVFNDGVNLLFAAFEVFAYLHGSAPGYTLLFDMKGVGLFHVLRLSVTMIRKMLVYQQEGMPIRLKAIHVMNSTSLVTKIMYLMKPFMKKELIDMITFHTDMEPVYKALTKECLPAEYGGKLESIDKLHEKFEEQLRDLKGYFLEQEATHRIKNSSSKKEDNSSLEGSLENLAIH